jgi:hypothetical protein
MPVITNFGDSNTSGNTTLQQNLTVQGAFSQFYGNILASSSTLGIGNVAVPFGNVFAVSANLLTLNTSVLISQTNFQVQGNITASNGLTTTNVVLVNANVSGVANTFSLVVVSNIGVGTVPTGNSLTVQGNVYVSNTIVSTNVATNLANISGTANTQTLIATANIGIGTLPFGNTLSVLGNVYVSNSILTTNITGLNFVNVSTLSNVTTLIATSNMGVGTAPFGNALSVQGNLWVSNALSTPNIVASLANITTMNVTTANVTTLNTAVLSYAYLNVTTLNTVSIYGQSGSVGIGTATNLGAALQVQGNVYASNGFQVANLSLSGTIYYNEDVFKRGPYLLPNPSNAATIQAWISATCNASSQPSRSWWATSPAPVYANVTSGPVNGGSNFQGGVLLPDGRVLFCPYGTSNVGIYNPFTNLFTSIAPFGAKTPLNVLTTPVLLPTGNVIFTPISSTANIVTYNPLTFTLSNSYLPSSGFVGAVLDPSGNVTMMPYTTNSNVGTYNPVLNTFSNIVKVANDGSMIGAVLLPNGNVIGIPFTNSNIIQYNPLTNPPTVSNSVNLGGSGTAKFAGGVLTPNGNVILVPFSATGTSNVGVFNPTTLAYSNITTSTGASAFIGGVLLPSGNVIMSPSNSSNVGMFDTVALTYSNSVPGGPGASAFSGAILLPSGQVVFVPFNSANVGVLNTMVPAPKEFCLSPFFNKY